MADARHRWARRALAQVNIANSMLADVSRISVMLPVSGPCRGANHGLTRQDNDAVQVAVGPKRAAGRILAGARQGQARRAIPATAARRPGSRSMTSVGTTCGLRLVIAWIPDAEGRMDDWVGPHVRAERRSCPWSASYEVRMRWRRHERTLDSLCRLRAFGEHEVG
jgi:hypothetical protein